MDKDDTPEISSIWEEARSHIERGEYDRAIETYKYILIRYADDPVAVEYANAYLGDVFLTVRRLKPAEEHLKKAIASDPHKPHYHYLLGFTYSVAEQWTRAVKEFRKALLLDPDKGEYERGLGWATFNGGDKIEGISHMYRALDLSPSNVHLLTDLGTAMLVLGNIEKAREYGEKALRLDPAYASAHRFLEMVSRVEKMNESHSAR